METGGLGIEGQGRIFFSIESELLYKEIRVDIHGYGQWKEIHVWVPLAPLSVC